MVIFMRLIHLTALLLFLTGCAGLDQDPTKDWSVERFYTEAKTALKEGNYATAIKHFETLEARYPYGPYAEQAQLEVAYAYYKDNEPASAIAAANRFIRLHPTHPNTDYAYYLKGLANFNDKPNLLERAFTDQDLSNRDPRGMREAYDAFRGLTEQFPHSRYAEDSRNRMAYLVNFLAKSEINVALFYYSRGAYVATVNRTRYVIERYQRTPAVEDALGLQALSYRKMGMDSLVKDTLRVLQMNFPASRYIGELSGDTPKPADEPAG
jgi:outer membrane protein assembly factor BamD